jgi:hypothetical protein
MRRVRCADAVHAAANADATVIVIGLSIAFEAEGFDRTHVCPTWGHQ